MGYISIARRKLTLTLSDSPLQGAYSIPVELRPRRRYLSSLLENVIHDDVLDPAQKQRDREKGIFGVEYWHDAPDPWLIAIAYIMWEGIIQGMTWDYVKFLVAHALKRLRSYGLAPALPRRRILKFLNRKQTTSTEIGFSWQEYALDGSKQREMFIGLRRRQESLSEEGIKWISEEPPKLERNGDDP
jgi:hypothetical protein